MLDTLFGTPTSNTLSGAVLKSNVIVTVEANVVSELGRTVTVNMSLLE
jgi:hypothetical protein